MKVIVLSEILNNKYRDMILGTAEKVGAEVCFVEREDEIPEDFKDASGSYGVSIAEHIIAVALMMMRRIDLFYRETLNVAGNLTLEYTIKRNVELFCENLICYAEGLPMNQVVDRNRGY